MTVIGTANEADIERAAAVLAAGGLVAFPTETVYGLGADASDPEAVGRVFSVKGRPTDHPLIVHIADAAAVDQWAVDVPTTARLLADAFWPGPLTLLLERAPSVPDAVTGGRPTVGLRVPDHPVARALLRAFAALRPGAPAGVAAPSANRFGRVSPTTADHVRADLGDDVDLVLDGGPCLVGVESTIVDCTRAEPVVLRLGGVSLERLADVLGSEPGVSVTDDAVTQAGGARAPGMLEAHYAPRARVEVVEATTVVARAGAIASARPGAAVVVLAPMAVDDLPDEVIELEPAGPADDFARVLYDRLRQADRLGADVLLVVPPPATGVGAAVRDRLRRAAAASDPSRD
ncbi:MAG: L-threonylcarbamoyladenylate synthase [Acidimicrobiales bacterium]